MTPEEKFHNEVWWVLQKLRYISISTRAGDPLIWVMQARPIMGAGIPPIGVRQAVLLKLEEWNSIKIIEQKGRDDTYGKDFIYTFELLQPKFDELYQVYRDVNESQGQQSQPIVDLTPQSPFHQPTMAEIQKDADESMKELHRQAFEERLQRKAFKIQRILIAKVDKHTHALDTLIEWAEHHGDGKSFSLDYHYFNFEDRMDDSRMLERFLDKLKSAGCFESWSRTNYAGGTRFGFSEPSLEKLKNYKSNRKETDAQEKDAAPPPSIDASIFYNKEAGIGYVGEKYFKFKDHQPEYRVFAKLYDNINKKVARAKVLELMGLKEVSSFDQTEDSAKARSVSKDTATYEINELAKKIRERTGLTTNTLVVNNGNLTLLGIKLKHPPK